MGAELKAWKYLEEVIGKSLTDRLRNGGFINISTSGEIYRIDAKREKLFCLTKKEQYCVHAIKGDFYPFADKVLIWWTYLKYTPDKLEKVVKSQNRTSMQSVESIVVGCVMGNLSGFREDERYLAERIWGLVESEDIKIEVIDL